MFNKFINKTKMNPSENFLSKVEVQGFPSRIELYSELDRFLEARQIKKNYTSNDKDCAAQIKFTNPVIIFIY